MCDEFVCVQFKWNMWDKRAMRAMAELIWFWNKMTGKRTEKNVKYYNIIVYIKTMQFIDSQFRFNFYTKYQIEKHSVRFQYAWMLKERLTCLKSVPNVTISKKKYIFLVTMEFGVNLPVDLVRNRLDVLYVCAGITQTKRKIPLHNRSCFVLLMCSIQKHVSHTNDAHQIEFSIHHFRTHIHCLIVCISMHSNLNVYSARWRSLRMIISTSWVDCIDQCAPVSRVSYIDFFLFVQSDLKQRCYFILDDFFFIMQQVV